MSEALENIKQAAILGAESSNAENIVDGYDDGEYCIVTAQPDGTTTIEYPNS